MAWGIGLSLKFDQNMLSREFGYYVGVLVDIDLASSLPGSIILNIKKEAVIVSLDYENLLDFYTLRNSLGNIIADRRH